MFTFDFLRQTCTHAQPRLVDRDSVDHRVGSCQIDVLENTRMVISLRRTLTAMKAPIEVNEHGLARRYVSDQLKSQCIECDRFRRDQILRPTLGSVYTEHQWPYAMRVTKSK